MEANPQSGVEASLLGVSVKPMLQLSTTSKSTLAVKTRTVVYAMLERRDDHYCEE
jgi:hypothetical protein